MDPDRTVSTGAVWSASFEKEASKTFQQVTKETPFVVIGTLRVEQVLQAV